MLPDPSEVSVTLGVGAPEAASWLGVNSTTLPVAGAVVGHPQITGPVEGEI